MREKMMIYSPLKLVVVICGLFITGCATDIHGLHTRVDHDEKRGAIEDTFAGEPAIVKVPVDREAFIVSEPDAPELNRLIAVSFHNTPIRTAIRSIAREFGAGVIFDTTTGKEPRENHREPSPGRQQLYPTPNNYPLAADQAGKDLKKQSSDKTENNEYGAFLDRNLTLDFKGRVGDLFSNLSDYTGYFFTLKKGTLIVKERETFRVVIPNYPELLKEIQANMEGQGAEGVTYDELTSNLTYTANYPGHMRIKETLESLRDNMALITMRVLAMNVKLTDEKNRGIDWTKISFGHKSLKQAPFGPFEGETTSGTSGTTDDSLAPLWKTGVAAVGAATGFNLYYQAADFTLSGFINLIDKYGKTSIIQNISVQTLSGRAGKLEALTEVPYISKVGVSSLSNNTASTQATAETEKAKFGVTMEITPRWSKREGTLTVKLNIDVLGVNRFLQISAGNLGTFTQPETTKNSISTTLRLTPFQVGVIGGLIFDKSNGSATGVPGDNYLSKAYSGSKEKEELVVLVKPTVYEFVFAN